MEAEKKPVEQPEEEIGKLFTLFDFSVLEIETFLRF